MTFTAMNRTVARRIAATFCRRFGILNRAYFRYSSPLTILRRHMTSDMQPCTRSNIPLLQTHMTPRGPLAPLVQEDACLDGITGRSLPILFSYLTTTTHRVSPHLRRISAPSPHRACNIPHTRRVPRPIVAPPHLFPTPLCGRHARRNTDYNPV